MSINTISVDLNDQVSLDVPVIWTLYPYFHPNRPRFFNMATLYSSVLHGIRVGLIRAFPNKKNFLPPTVEMADKSYVRWEANGGVDLRLPAFKLTNRQMLWLCIVHKFATKYHRSTPKLVGQQNRIANDNLHINLMRKPGFVEAFQCENKFNKMFFDLKP